MSRKPVHRELPKLAAVHPRFHGFPPRETALRCLIQALRRTVAQVRKDQPVAFYSQQQVAGFFGVPQRTVHLAYRQFVREGLLTSRRGSGTLLLGRKLQPANPPRGVVGLPIWTTGFVLLPYWRTFFIRIEEELRRGEFVADTVHYETSPASGTELADRLLAHHLDYVIWLYPLTRMRQVFERLADAGVRGIAVVHQPREFPQVTQYHTAWDLAYLQALTVWHREGVRELIVVATPESDAAYCAALNRALARLPLRHTLWHGSNLDALRAGAQVGVVFPDDLLQTTLGRRNPQALVRLMQRARVLVTHSVLIEEVPPDVRVDVVGIDWTRLTHRIAQDLAVPPDSLSAPRVVVQARWLPRVPACQFVAAV